MAQQAKEERLRPAAQRDEIVERRVVQVGEIMEQFQRIRGLDCRAIRDPDVASEHRRSAKGVALGQVELDRDRGSADLIEQRAAGWTPMAGSQSDAAASDPPGHLPSAQCLVVTHHQDLTPLLA